jgi:hypothetical protein
LQKNIQVNFASELKALPEVSFTPLLESENQQLHLTIENSSYSPAYGTTVRLLGWQKKSLEKKEIKILPPLGKERFIIKAPSLWFRLFKKPKYHLSINSQDYEIDYPQLKLNLKEFFVNLWQR